MQANRFATLFLTGVTISFCLSLLALTGCAYDPCNPGWGIHACDGTPDDSVGDTSTSDQGGGDAAVLPLPFQAGTAWRCTQGANGEYSHQYDSTIYGADFDTPNDSVVEIYAVVSGVARVHMESATSNFGYHVLIDVGNGFYVVIAHLSEIFVTDGQEVAAGTLIGYDGCTGACSGDHSHVGLMEGDASEMAQYGTSVDVSFYARDTNVDGSVIGAVAVRDLVCGTTDGHLYESALPVSQWHPNGSLVKVPSSPNVYLVQDGKARHVADETTFWSYNLDFDGVALISDEELACLGTGDEISSSGSISAAYDSDETAWLVVADTDGSSWKQKIASGGRDDVLASWGLSGGDLADADALDDDDLDRYATRSGTAPFRDGSIVKENTASDVYVVSDGIALPVKDWDAYLLMGFANRAILTVSDGEVASVMGNDVGSCSAGIWCLDAEAITTCGGGLDLGSGAEAGGEEIDTSSSAEASEDTGGSTETEEEEEVIEDTGTVEDDETDTSDSSSEASAEENDSAVDDLEEEDTDVEVVDTAEDEEPTEDMTSSSSTDYVYLSDPFVCLSTTGFRTPYDNADAYAVGYGEGLDWTLQIDFLASPDAFASGYVCLDTTDWPYDDYELTLLSSIQSDGTEATTYADTGDWWDNYAFCSDSTDPVASDFCVSQGGWDYLVGFTKSTSGLFANGDGA